MASFALRKSIAAPAEIVFDVLTDHRGQAELSALRSSRIEREGEPPPNGVGAIRALGVGGVTIREQVTVFDRPNRFEYKMLSGVPAKAHSATVELAQQGTRTALVYRVDSIPKIPVPGAAWLAIVRPVIQHLVNGVVKEAERRARMGS
jgi:Polyketide cyclase / dehydrase and lipid transport